MNDEYPDTNGNGVPDAFENRPSILEVLDPDLVRMETRLTNNDFVEASEYRKYRVYSVPTQGAVLLEIEEAWRAQSAACIFRSRSDLKRFLEELEDASLHAFGLPET